MKVSDMPFTKGEQKLLEQANWASGRNPNKTLLRVGVVMGLLAGVMAIGYGLFQLAGVIPPQGDAFLAIRGGGLFLGYMLIMYEYVRFKRDALSLIRKLTDHVNEMGYPS